MDEKVKSVDFYVPKFNYDLKGHAKIVLNNPYHTQVIEHDNVVQSAIVEKRLSSLGAWHRSVWEGTWSPLWKSLFGGILLFDSAIPVGSEYVPAGVSMVGNGSADTANSAAPLAMGSWDSIKSSINANSCVQVYNWNQQQGNGDIASVCLTSRVGGYIGYGNTDNVKKGSMSLSADFGMSDIRYTGSSSNTNTPSYHLFNNHMVTLSADNTNKNVIVKIDPLVVNEFDILDRSRTLTLPYTTALAGSTDLIATTAFVADGKGKFAITGRQTTAIGDSRQVVVVDMNTETLTEYTVVNNTSSSWAAGLTNRNPGDLCGFDGDHVYFANVRNTNATVYKIKLSDNSVVATITGVDTRLTNSGYVPIVQLTKNHKVICTDRDAGNYLIWDELANTKKVINMGSLYVSSGYVSNYVGYYDNENIIADASEVIQYGGRTIAGHNPMYLATINNLSEVVQKTNEDTMAITYTLEKVTS